MKKKKKLSLLQKRALTGFAFITPWLIGFLWFYVKSLIQAVRFSLSKMEMLESGGYTLKFTGLDNFKYALFQDPTYNQILATSIRDIVIDVPLIIFFSLFIAMICNGKFKGRTLVRAILFLPIIMNAGAINNAIEMASRDPGIFLKRMVRSSPVFLLSFPIVHEVQGSEKWKVYLCLFSDN